MEENLNELEKIQNSEIVDNNKENINYKIKSGITYTVKRQDYNGKTFYSIGVSKVEADGTTSWANKQVSFPAGTDLKDRTKIKINRAFEDFFFRKGDKFCPVFKLVVTDFEIVGQSDEVRNQAYDEFNSDIEQDLPF